MIGFLQAIGLVLLFQLSLALLAMVVKECWPSVGTYETSFTFFFLSIGWTQLLYLPLFLARQRRKGMNERAKGVAAVIGALFLLTSACNLIFSGTSF